ncbi:hypothetical protein ABK040_006828 [Willaertia magna]
MKKTTFVRKGASVAKALPAGTKPSVHNGQLLVSSGLHDLDVIIGGGFPLGSLILIEEDKYSEYCQHLIRYFLSEGISNKHTCFSNTFTPNSNYLFNYSKYLQENKEKRIKEEEEEEKKEEEQKQKETSSNELTKKPTNSIMDRLNRKTQQQQQKKEEDVSSELKIAWRYKEYVEQQVKLKQQRQAQSTVGLESSSQKSSSGNVVGTVMCHEYDLSKPIQEELLKEHSDSIFNFKHINYDDLLKEIIKVINSCRNYYNTKSTGDILSKSVIRIGLQSIGSIFYKDNENKTELFKFLIQLKTLLRSSLSVCVCTIPKNTIPKGMIHQIEQLSDISLSMDSFTGENLNVSEWEFNEYSGLFHIKKLLKMNSLTYNFIPDTLNYAFKLKKRKLYIERLHLPPEETREASNPERPKFKASNDVEKHKIKVERVLKTNSQLLNDTSSNSEDSGVLGCASAGGKSSSLDF